MAENFGNIGTISIPKTYRDQLMISVLWITCRAGLTTQNCKTKHLETRKRSISNLEAKLQSPFISELEAVKLLLYKGAYIFAPSHFLLFSLFLIN